MRSKDAGYKREQVMVIRNTDALKNNTASFRNELQNINGISHAAMTSFLPVNGSRNNDAFFTTPGLDANTALSMQSWPVDENYIPTLGMQLIKGRNFSSTFRTDSKAIIINEAAAKFLSTEEVLNKKLYRLEDVNTKKITEYHIIGVVKNFHFNSLRETITPMTLMYGADRGSISVRINAADASPVIAAIKNKWQSMAPAQPFDYSFMDEDFNRQYAADQRTGQIFITFTILAILIACLGIFALVSYAAEQRVKEIGIRKVLGASIFTIVKLLSFNFLKLVLVASVVAFPVAWWIMNIWLQGFAYRIDMSWEIFALAGSAALLIALITVSFQSIRSAMANPVKSLKLE
jgi:putative ABC transport system permease protein